MQSFVGDTSSYGEIIVLAEAARLVFWIEKTVVAFSLNYIVRAGIQDRSLEYEVQEGAENGYD